MLSFAEQLLLRERRAGYLFTNGTGYNDCPLEPLYSFGEGLTYTEFEYGEIELDKSEIGPDDEVTAGVTVKNIGERAGTETVQLYIRDRYASISRPLKERKGFKKVELRVGEQKEVTLKININMLKFYRVDLDYIAEPGEFQVVIGGNSKTQTFKSFFLCKFLLNVFLSIKQLSRFLGGNCFIVCNLYEF